MPRCAPPGALGTHHRLAAHDRLPLVVLADEQHAAGSRSRPGSATRGRCLRRPRRRRRTDQVMPRAPALALRQRHARRQRELAADDGGGGHHAQLLRWRAASRSLAAAVAVGAAESRPSGGRVGAAREQVASAAVVGEDAVARRQRGHHAPRRRLPGRRRCGCRASGPASSLGEPLLVGTRISIMVSSRARRLGELMGTSWRWVANTG